MSLLKVEYYVQFTNLRIETQTVQLKSPASTISLIEENRLRTHISKIAVEDLHIALNDLQTNELVVVPIDQTAKEQIGISLINDLVVFPFDEIGGWNASSENE